MIQCGGFGALAILAMTSRAVGRIQPLAIDSIAFRMSFYPLCAGEGDQDVGATVHAFESDPMELTVVQQWRSLGAVRSLDAGREGSDVRLRWQPVTGADAYRVYRSDAAGAPRPSWVLQGEVSGTTFTDTGAAAGPDPVFYSVVPLGPGGEGEW